MCNRPYERAVRDGSPLMIKKTIEDMPIRIIDGVEHRCINDLLFYSTSYKRVDLEEVESEEVDDYVEQLTKEDITLKEKLRQASGSEEDLKRAIYDIVWSGYTPKQVAVLLGISEMKVQYLYHEAKDIIKDEEEPGSLPIGTSDEDYKKVLDYRLKGYRTKWIAEKLNKDYDSVANRVLLANSYIRAYKEYQQLSKEEQETIMEIYEKWGENNRFGIEVRERLNVGVSAKRAINYMILMGEMETIERGSMFEEVYNLRETGMLYKDIGAIYGKLANWAIAVVRDEKEWRSEQASKQR